MCKETTFDYECILQSRYGGNNNGIVLQLFTEYYNVKVAYLLDKSKI